jgi:micrococcal nuclease
LTKTSRPTWCPSTSAWSPENTATREYYGPASTLKNSELVSGKQITLYKDVFVTDQPDRMLRYVFVGDTFVNYELVTLGFANTMRYPPDTACAAYFDETEHTAAAYSLGMWTAALLYTTPMVVSGAVPHSCSSNQYNCSGFGTHAKTQVCFTCCVSVGSGDVHRLDGDSNGIACENLPLYTIMED